MEPEPLWLSTDTRRYTGSAPKILDVQPPISPAEVLDAIDRALASGAFWVFPGRGSKALWRARRFLPGMVWKRMRRIEGR